MLNKSINNKIATLTLNRPELHNAFDDQLIVQLIQELESCNNDPNIRVVMLAANGKSFCAGADMNWMQRMASYSREENLRDANALAKLMQTLNNLNKPTIALIQGAVYGGGVGLVACCDIAIAVPEAVFCLSEVKIGLVPSVISPYVIAAMGQRAARRYFLTAEKFNTQEAFRLGLIHAITQAPVDLYNMGEQIAQNILANGPSAVATAKKLIAKIANQPIDDQIINHTTQLIADTRVSAEGQEGLKSFLEKCKPNWTNT